MSDSSSVMSLLEIRPEWLSQCKEQIERYPLVQGSQAAEEIIFSIYCHTDIISSCSEKLIIPENVEIDKIENISDRFDSRKDEPGGVNLIGRYNKLTLSDGHRQCVAMDYRGLLQGYQQRSFSVSIGCKIALKHINVRRGALLLDGNCVCLLGGNVLYDGKSHLQREQLGLAAIVSHVFNEEPSKDEINISIQITNGTTNHSIPSNTGASIVSASTAHSLGGVSTTPNRSTISIHNTLAT